MIRKLAPLPMVIATGAILLVASVGDRSKITTVQKKDDSLSRANLQRIGNAFSDYAADSGVFPQQARQRKEDGPRLFSWRVTLLPYLGELELFEKFNHSEPWDSPSNLALLKAMPEVYRNTLYDPAMQAQGYTCFHIVYGPGTFYSTPNAIVRLRITSGPSPSSRVMIAVESTRMVPWTKPEDLAYSAEATVPCFGPDGDQSFRAVFFDGTVRTIPKTISARQLRRWIIPPWEHVPRDPLDAPED